jgi:hypothetical protein
MNIKSYKQTLIFIFLLIFILSFAFYWYEYRPAQATKECAEKTRTFINDNESGVKKMDDLKAIDWIYDLCIKRKGIIK